ncbi:MAG: hypothetical protein JSW50_15030 [Candidatus Latescibacterota bacterium]|nr:MAG: hypothetical protein JSW50_15030 [Candidatus Latescibacterota bacterium]
MIWFRNAPVKTTPILALTLLVVLLANCGGEDSTPVDTGIDPPQGPDTTAPAAVADLRLRAPTQSTLALVWTAPGDDGTEGTAASYDIRFSDAPIDDSNWEHAHPIDPTIVPTPKPAGQIETIVIKNLDSGAMYYFALKASDEVPNQSELSNCCNERTIAETNPPGDITDLSAVAIDASSYELTWTAPGDDYTTGTATRYDIRYSARPIANEEDWNDAMVVADTPPPQPAGETQSFVLSGLNGQGFGFAIKTVDELDNWSGLSNSALALGFNELIWVFPVSIPEGGQLNITFRASPSDATWISLSERFWWWETRACGAKVVTELLREPLAEGVYTITFDFIDPATGQYLPTGSYELHLCYGPHLQEHVWVSLY